MKANKIRFLAGGLAAVVLMSNMATNVVFAEELDAPVLKTAKNGKKAPLKTCL